jgi:hypothetical protein
MAFEVGATVLILGLAATGVAPSPSEPTAISDGALQLQAPPAETVPAPPAPAPESPPAAAPGKRPPAATEPASETEEEKEGDGEGTADPAEAAPAAPAPAAPAPSAPSAEGANPAPEAPAPGAPASEATPPGAAAPTTSDAAAAPASAASAPEPLGAGPAPVAQEPVVAPAPVEKSDFQVGLTTPAGNATADKPADEVSLQQALGPGAAPMPTGLSLSVGASMSFGYSTFLIGSEFERDPSVDWSLSLGPAYLFAGGTRVSANASLSQELTLSGGADDPQTLIFGDVGLSVARPIYRFEKGPILSGSLSMQLPTSEASQTETLITSLGGRLSASQPIGGFFVSVGSGFRKNFHRYTNPVREPGTGRPFVTEDGLVIEEIVTGLTRNGGNELSGTAYFDGESNNTSMVWSNSAMAAYQLTDALALSLMYSLSHSWTYNSYPLDELSGVGATEGRGRNDSHGGTLSANYQATDQLGIGLGMSTFGPTRTADDKRIRFPFFAFEGKENNMTSFSISVTYTEKVGL